MTSSLAIRQLPQWIPPSRNSKVELPKLKVLNSFTRTKNDFIPADPEGEIVTWYTCGPTVYDGKKSQMRHVSVPRANIVRFSSWTRPKLHFH
jgi:hypothetical protein